MPTHRPHHPTLHRASSAAPLIVVSGLAAWSATAMLLNFGWTSAYRPDAFHERLRRLRDHPAAADPCGGPGAVASAPVQPAVRPPAVACTVSSTTDGAADGGDESTDGEKAGGAVAHAAVGVDEETATAHWFVTAALDGDLGDAHQEAARTAVAVATEHGFVDDPTRVAEALVVFLHPDHR